MALVTGASGFLGRPLVAALLAQGRPVVAFCRRPEGLGGLCRPDLRVVTGDLRDPASYAPFLAAGASLFHLAGERHRPRARVRNLEEVNVRATLDLLRRAGEKGASRIVYVATALIYGSASEGRARSEAAELDPTSSAYVRSRVEAVRGVRELVRQGLPAVTVCPTIVFGPDSPSHPNRVTSEIRRLARSGPGIRLGGGRQLRDLVFVDDVVRGILAAEERGAAGEEYILGGEEISHRELARRVAAISGRRGGVVLSLPAGVARGAAWVLDRLRGNDAGAGYATSVENLLREWRFSSDKARRDLGYRPLSLAEGLGRTLDQLRFSGGAERYDRG